MSLFNNRTHQSVAHLIFFIFTFAFPLQLCSTENSHPLYKAYANASRCPALPQTHKPFEFVTASLIGQLGNQCFILAAAISLALDHGATPLFPDLINKNDFGIPTNYQHIFFRLCAYPLSEKMIQHHYHEPTFTYTPISYVPAIKLHGYFQSENHFWRHKQEILELFAPSDQIKSTLERKYPEIIHHPCSVALHLRSYLKDDPEQKIYPNYTRHYYQKAMALFPEEALFVIFSNDMQRCKSILKGMAKNMLFIEGEPHYHDFYLMSFCKHQIIANSTFSWWAAYMNRNPEKIVVAPRIWGYTFDSKDLLPSEWTVIDDN